MAQGQHDRRVSAQPDHTEPQHSPRILAVPLAGSYASHLMEWPLVRRWVASEHAARPVRQRDARNDAMNTTPRDLPDLHTSSAGHAGSRADWLDVHFEAAQSAYETILR